MMDDVDPDTKAAKTAIGKDGKDIKILFVQRFKHEAGKSDKGEIRILAITPFRIYVITTKQSPKVDFSFHILELLVLDGSQSMSVTMYDTYLFQLSLKISASEKQQSHRFIFEKEDDVGKVISYMIALLRTNFLNANVEKQVTWKVSSPEKEEALQGDTDALALALSGEGQSCGGFSLAYLCICDYYKQTSDHAAEVCWDIDKIYASHRCKDFKLDDFDRLEIKDLVPLIAALAYNTWFTSLTASSLKLSNEVVDVIIKVIRRTLSIEEIVLTDCHLNKDHVQKLALALGANPNTVIKRINFSRNHLEDKGVSNLTGAFGTMQNGLEMINFSEVGMTNKGCSFVANCLKSNKLMPTTLTMLNLSGNPLKLEGVQTLCNFFSQPNALTDLHLSNAECPLDLLFTALHRGCQLSLQNLDLSGNAFFSKKTKDASITQSLLSLQQFFSMSRALKFANLSNTKIPANGIKAILVGLLNNPVLTDVGLDLSCNELKSSGAAELTSCLREISISKLNLANNGLEQDLIPICEALQNNNSIKELDLSHNVTKTKNTNAIAEALAEILISETTLTKLSIADCKLRVDAAVLFDCVGTNETLTSLDIRGNGVGDTGARLLAKAIQINTKLREVLLDRNNITSKGLQDLAQAMERNFSLHSIPLPMSDLTAAMKDNKHASFIKAYGQLEEKLIRNQSSKETTPEQAYKVHQGLLMSSIDHYTQHTDEYVVVLEDTISNLKSCTDEKVQKEIKKAGLLIKEADLFRQVLLELYSDPEHSKSLLEDMFNKVTNDVVNSVECVIKDNIDKMLKSASNICPTALNKEDRLKSIKEELVKDSLIEKIAISDSIKQLGQSEIAYKLCESNLVTATNIAEQLKKLFVDVLQNSINTLSTIGDNQTNDTVFENNEQNLQVNGEVKSCEDTESSEKTIENSANNKPSDIEIKTNGESESDGDPSLSTPAVRLLNDISSKANFDLFDFSKPVEKLSSPTSLMSGSDDSDAFFVHTSRNRLNTDNIYNKKRKCASLKRRPTFYNQRDSQIEEVDIPIDVAPKVEKTPNITSPRNSTVTAPVADESDVVNIAEAGAPLRTGSFKERSLREKQSKSVDVECVERSHTDSVSSTDSRSSRLGSSLSMDDSLHDEDEPDINRNRLPSIRAFDDVSTHSSQLNVTKNRVKAARGRRAPTKVAKLAHMSASVEDLLAEDDKEVLTKTTKPRPKSEMPASLTPLFEEMIQQPRGASEKLKREPPARPSPPTKPETPATPSRPEPPFKADQPPARPERPKKPEMEKKPEASPQKEKKVKPPAGAFQLPALPSLGGMLKKRSAPKHPDSADGCAKADDGVVAVEQVKVDIPLNDSGENVAPPVKPDSATTTEAAPIKPPPPSVMKKPISPTESDSSHPFEMCKSPEATVASEASPGKQAPVKKPPRGIPMGGLGGSALMAEMNKKLHHKADDEEASPTKAASTPPKPLKPTPPQRPPSLKRCNTEGRPNVPDRPKLMQRSQKCEAGEEGETTTLSETINGQCEGAEESQKSSDDKTSKDGDSDAPVTAFV